VLHGVSLTVSEGTVEVVLGRNGVGKTTLLSTIAGLLPLRSGVLRLDGTDIGAVPPFHRAARGLALVQEGNRIFRDRTIMENIVLGTYSRRFDRAERRELCIAILDQFPALKDRTKERAGSLSGGQQKMLAIAQALASRPRVLLLDEPSGGLAPAVVEDLFHRVRALADDGLAVVLVEQLAEQAIHIASHVTVLNDGVVAASGGQAEFEDLSRLREVYLGSPENLGTPVIPQ
jgi:branched-chain amino acid transport system ATP-binding protein